MTQTPSEVTYSAWNPGIETDIPLALRELETIYNPEHTLTSLEEINRLVTDTGLSPMELINLKPERLVLHELIVRVTADIVVLEGETEEDLGINFRAIAKQILDQYIYPRMEEIENVYQHCCQQIEAAIESEIATVIARLTPVTPPQPGLWQRLIGRKPSNKLEHQSREEREFTLINDYKTRAAESTDELQSAVFRSVHRVLGSIVRTRGFIGNDPQYLTHICILNATNILAGKVIGRQVGEWVNEAIDSEDFLRIPDAENPVLFSLKGASASGKSFLRPMLRSKLASIGIANEAYGTISPDIWRKLLLDYDSLGKNYKYAGRFTSHEVSIIDGKLDRYIRDKSEQSHSIPHLVVDRFRFDSFASEKISSVLHNTYVRYIDTMYMYFIITPPEATVERGWQRGLERGRYKAVEDYLGHCVEAYSGMSKVLFKWLGYDKPRFSFKFYDNSVAKGTYPILIARGSQGWMQIFEPERFVDIERFRRINIHATSALEVPAKTESLSVKNNLGFLRQCIKRIDFIELVDAESENAYLAIRDGKFEITDPTLFVNKMQKPALHEILNELAPSLLDSDKFAIPQI